jgi:multidrug/hemolysin transport system permease protein
MRELSSLIKRNTKLFFKDKGMFFTSLITPMILLVLYATFLGNVYKDSFLSSLGGAVSVSDEILGGYVGGQLVSSILAVSCVTVAFCSNMLIVQDKFNESINDIKITPINPAYIAVSYYAATLLSTLIVCFGAMIVCFGYLLYAGFYLSVLDVIKIVCDILLVAMFGTALSSIVNFFLSTQGQVSAVGTIVSSGYGFICGAYMPISQFSEGLQRIISFLPGTYATSLLRNHSMRGVIEAMREENIPDEAVDILMDVVDCNVYFFDTRVEEGTMYLILLASIAVLVGGYILLNAMSIKKARAK